MTKAQDSQPPVDDVVPAEAPAVEAPDTATAAKVAITLSVTHTTRDGETHEPDTEVDLSAAEARHVLHIGHGRLTAPKGSQS
ncbi:hypothetical protein ASD11_01215 [Aeromicrobium sp. Root495]|uniref:hypothetical protein n=1 Tax=Aeromicrobium sp. Root495 TaxID=1736550 RepID=UPI000702189D|nr:hypothetical protein [Aeromicrobium sp. Root495]KQY58315.1 hypothetical protein ASD11_01215 [Aeromicrobium sp. Root495]